MIGIMWSILFGVNFGGFVVDIGGFVVNIGGFVVDIELLFGVVFLGGFDDEEYYFHSHGEDGDYEC